MIPRSKLGRFCGWKLGKIVEKLDPLETHRIHGSKSTKYHQTNISQKKRYGYFCEEFLKLGKINKIGARKWRGRTPKCESTWL